MSTKVRRVFEKLKHGFNFGFDERGREIPDPTPVEMPLGYHRPPSLQETMARYMRSAELLAQQQGAETFEEAEDFDVGEDFDPSSPWEREFDPVTGKEMYRQEREFLDAQRREFDKGAQEHFARKRKQKPKEKPAAEQEEE